MKHLLIAISLAALSFTAHARIGESVAETVHRYGNPERDSLKTSGLLYFRKDNLCYITHFDRGHCDVISIFSGHDVMGFPDQLGDEVLYRLLREDGGAGEWEMAPGFTINGVWNSKDGRSFAIYDTMRHKLVIMTRDAYLREKSAKEKALGSPPVRLR